MIHETPYGYDDEEGFFVKDDLELTTSDVLLELADLTRRLHEAEVQRDRVREQLADAVRVWDKFSGRVPDPGGMIRRAETAEAQRDQAVAALEAAVARNTLYSGRCTECGQVTCDDGCEVGGWRSALTALRATPTEQHDAG